MRKTTLWSGGMLPSVGKAEATGRNEQSTRLATPRVVGMIDSTEELSPFDVRSHATSRDSGKVRARASTRRSTGQLTEEFDDTSTRRWVSSKGRLLSLDEAGPHNRSHDRPHKPQTAPQCERIATADTGTFRSKPRISTAIHPPRLAFGLDDPQSRSERGPDKERVISPGGGRHIRKFAQAELGVLLVPRLELRSRGSLGMEFAPMSWEDPFIQQRKAQLERGRQIRSRGNIMGLLDGNGRGLQTAREHRLQTAGPKISAFAPLSVRLLSGTGTRKSSQSSRRVYPERENLAWDDTAIHKINDMVAEADQHAMRSAEMPRHKDSFKDKEDNPHGFYEVPWDIPTQAEIAAIPMQDGVFNDKVRSDNFSEYLGKRLVHHLSYDVVGQAMNEVRWGDRRVPVNQCGLQELDDALKYSTQLNREFLEKMKATKSFVDTMNRHKYKDIITEGRAHSLVTKHESNEYLEYLQEAKEVEQEQDLIALDPNYDVGNLQIDNLDMMLKNLTVMKDRSALFGDNKQKRFLQTSSVAQKESNAEHEEEYIEKYDHPRQYMKTREVMSHAAFHRDLDYIRFKTTEFRHELTDGIQTQRAKDARAQAKLAKPELNKQLIKKAITALHYMRFSILQAENLPIMEEHKRTNDTYVRCSLYCDDKVVKDVLGSGHEQTACTKVAWDTKKPIWNEDFMFTVVFQPTSQVYLSLEVMDAATVDITTPDDEYDDVDVRVPSDVCLGQVKFLIMHGGIQVMSPEVEVTDWYFLKDPDGNDGDNLIGFRYLIMQHTI